MEQIKVLNLYAGIGGNRKLWENVQVTAVEYDPDIANVYSHFYPNDKIIVGDAHQYLLENYTNFDFIWSSPPCPTHSEIRRCGVVSGQYPAVYPDISLWEEITLLKYHTKGIKHLRWVVENVISYYDPIIQPSLRMDRHNFWCNFTVVPKQVKKREVVHCSVSDKSELYGYNLSGFDLSDKRKVLRNMVNPEVGKHIFETAMKMNVKQEQMGLFA